MSQGPRHINTDRSLNRPTEQRPTEASALHQVSLSGQPDFFQNEQPAPQRPEPPRPVSYIHLTLPTNREV